jgi:tetratricopeptide (TPR) repeat protein
MLRSPEQFPVAARSKLILEQATAALHSGDPGDAERLLRKHLLEQPRDAAVLTKLAELANGGHRIEEATMLLRRAADADPSTQSRMALIRHLNQYVGAQPTLQEIEKLSASERTDFNALAIEAACQGALGNHVRQIAILEQLVAGNRRNVVTLKALGEALKTVNRTEEAIAALCRAVDAEPTYGEGWWTLSNFKSYKFTDRDVSAMRKAARRKISEEDALHIHFALGAAYEQRREFAIAFRHYEAGNALRRRGFDPQSMRITDLVDRALATFGKELFDLHKENGASTNAPIFVVGVHRSGSTLIEQILASHPLIEGTAELPVMQFLWERLARIASVRDRGPFEELLKLDGAAVTAIGNEYIERTQVFRTTDRLNNPC